MEYFRCNECSCEWENDKGVCPCCYGGDYQVFDDEPQHQTILDVDLFEVHRSLDISDDGFVSFPVDNPNSQKED